MKPRISMIGTGRWGKTVLQKFHHLGGLHLVYGHQNRDLLQPLNLRFTEDIDQLIEDSDAVVVATPSETHAEVAERVLQAKKDLFLEKPMALSSKDARHLTQLAEDGSCVLMIGHVLCYSTGFAKLNSMPGQTVSAHGKFLKTTSPEKYLNAYWDMGVHCVALAIALKVPMMQFKLNASAQAASNQRTFELQTRTPDGRVHTLLWDFLAPENQEDMLMVECRHFLACVKNRETPRTDGRQGVQTIEALERIHPEQHA
ncbi:MAG: Gfo/Idh/MocA family oxidoreductase [Candidatus Poribacteria bacterium]|nr:Gfo/Idh/MocA family oxidoreductase [Candidatus Poribacteria bacterium]MDE0506883.1 Gfo/Idh/MocA family oxidoreductase [Candidatus Poribacteria bacterium]